MQTDENVLEAALELAAAEPANRPEFYRLLLESTIFVLGSSGQLHEGLVTLKAGTKVEIQHWEKPDGSKVVPFFTSLSALQAAIKSDERYMALPARSFLAMSRGTHLILNPASDHGKEFTPAEVDALLAEGVNQIATQRMVKQATTVQIGQPANYPDEMVASLTKLFSGLDNVQAAYLALMFDPAIDEKPHLIVGIDAEGDFESIVRDAGTVAGDTSPKGEPVDLVRVKRGQSGLSEHFIKEVRPFYQRAPAVRGSRLKSLFGFGRS
jgi:hypothetical protein